MKRPAEGGFLRLSETVNAIIICLFCIILSGCSGPSLRPEQKNNICEIFRENSKWYKYAEKSHVKWGIPIPVLMAIMHQESGFVDDIKPPRTTCLCIFPGPRPSSAYGYSQAKDETWSQYCRATGNSGADRDDFEDAIDFIGWYCDISHRKCRIARGDAYNLYLAYHEGHGGFNRKTFQKKRWLMNVASNVQKRANTYKSQLASCEGEFVRKGGCCLWPF